VPREEIRGHGPGAGCELVARSPRQASAKRVAASTVAAAKELPAAQAGRSAPRRVASTGKPRRNGLRSRWQRQPSPPPPPDGYTARRKATQQASVGAGGDEASGGATCGRHGEMDTIVAAHRAAASRAAA